MTPNPLAVWATEHGIDWNDHGKVAWALFGELSKFQTFGATYEELESRLDKTRIFICGSDEWVELMVALYKAASTLLLFNDLEYANIIVNLLEREIASVEDFSHELDPYYDQHQERKRTYKPGEYFKDGDNPVDPR